MVYYFINGLSKRTAMVWIIRGLGQEVFVIVILNRGDCKYKVLLPLFEEDCFRAVHQFAGYKNVYRASKVLNFPKKTPVQ